MRVEFDRQRCDGWFQCVQEWDAFEMNVVEGKADLDAAEEDDTGDFVRDVPPKAQDLAIRAAEACPVDAIDILDDNGERIAPTG